MSTIQSLNVGLARFNKNKIRLGNLKDGINKRYKWQIGRVFKELKLGGKSTGRENANNVSLLVSTPEQGAMSLITT